MTVASFIHLLNQFQKALVECRELYLNGANEVYAQQGHAIESTAAEWIGTMDDLHRGLLIKLYISICGADHLWTETEEKLAGVLIHHLWQQQLTSRQVRDAIQRLGKQAESLTWQQLVDPFRRYPVLRSRGAELETCVMRVGNLLAKCDGHPTSLELDRLKSVQTEILAHVRTSGAPNRQTPDAPQEVTIDQKTPPLLGSSNPSPAPPATEPESAPTLDDTLAELDRLVGIDHVKSEIKSLVNYLKVQRMRSGAGLPETRIALHTLFCGNPGTGKTTVARIVGQVYRAMGILERGHLIETDRSGLVASYAGQTAPKTNAIVDSALGGILFIDEAYSLVTDQANDPYGHEAIQVLLKRMEDERDRLVVVLAGYPAPMTRLINSNPGLSSRFTRRLDFADYVPTELGQIFGRMCDSNHYLVRKLVQAKVLVGFDWLYQRRDERFGNGRLVRNLFERAIRRLSNRVVAIEKLSRQMLSEFEPDDIEFDQIPADAINAQALQKRRFDVRCGQCSTSSRLRAEALGCNVRCRKCGHRFCANWCPPLTPSHDAA